MPGRRGARSPFTLLLLLSSLALSTSHAQEEGVLEPTDALDGLIDALESLEPADRDPDTLLPRVAELWRRRQEAAAEAHREASARWSPFAPLEAPRPPPVEHPEWTTPIDRFVLARAAREGLEPAEEVDRRRWLRRVTFDLTGLPPTPEDVEAFLGDSSEDATARSRVVDRLLASRAFAERVARLWLDVARYADSDGFAIDSERPTLWRYRDWVIRHFDRDLPVSRFIRLQIAGDEIDGAGEEGLVAAGFLRLGPWEADNMVPALKRQDYLNEVTNATGAAFLGLTVGCARCHDHKYDPIPTRDYYSLQAFFTPLDRADRAAPYAPDELGEDLRERKQSVDESLRRSREDLSILRRRVRVRIAEKEGSAVAAITEERLDAAFADGSSDTTEEERRRHVTLRAQVDAPQAAARFTAIACSVANPPADRPAPVTHVLSGGAVTSPGEAVTSAFPTAVRWRSDELEGRLTALGDAAVGRRIALADWLSSDENPLVPRVFVNRLWQLALGVGLVSTPNDFGVNGSGPSHPLLLDWLTQRFIAGGWRVKPLLREIVLSRAYRTSTLHPRDAACSRIDPDNRLLWRAHHRRLDAEMLRDAILAVSGSLRDAPGGPGFYARIPDELGRDFPFFRWEPSPETERLRRTIYGFQRRNLVVPLLEAFDAPDLSESCERRRTSVTAPQVFALFNGDFAHEAAARFARRVVREVGLDRRRQVERVFRLAFGREPTEEEVTACIELVAAQEGDERRRRAERPLAEQADSHVRALASLCLVALNANEFLYLE